MSGILVRGDPRLAARAARVEWPDAELPGAIEALTRALDEFRREHGFGRAIAAPQLGIGKRLIVLNLGAETFAVVNPVITYASAQTFELWDDCLSVPDSLVRVRRHVRIALDFEDAAGRLRRWQTLDRGTSELMQHEIDHLDGVLMTDRAVGREPVQPISARSTLAPSSTAPKTLVGLADIALAES